MWKRGEILGTGASATVTLAVVNDQTFMPVHSLPSVMAVKSAALHNSFPLSRERIMLKEFEACSCVVRCYGSNTSIERRGEWYNLFLEYASGGSLFNCIRESGGGLPEDEARSPKKKKLKGVRGTPMYMAPESIRREEYGLCADIWVVGCTVLEMVTGKEPWECGRHIEKAALLSRIASKEYVPEIPSWLSNEARDFLCKCLVRDPKSRWTADMLLGHPFVSDAKSEFMETTVDEISSTTILPEASKEVEWMQISFDIPEPSYGCMLHDRPCSDAIASKD
ncbi:hypothetical protein RHMOL_Rhmol07G0163600 [Rhododendron molle]|uniref:Uncharacterized protein n=1 Tax=Rhododendron molle TaxID=49168 RepID=A0ACC0N1Z9_RHOML|nr:hypothetical protein RHMOL_Rhmol07G0163600 [Rhododendron molle]